MTGKISWYYINPTDETEMALVPGGWFQMGSDDSDFDAYDNEKPRHLHYVKAFYIGITCVAVSRFKKFVKATGHKNDKPWDKDPPDHPVRHVNWHDAKAYSRWSGTRLPQRRNGSFAPGGIRR